MANPFANIMDGHHLRHADQEDVPTIRWYLEKMLPWPGQDEDGCITVAWLSTRGAWIERQARTPADAESIVVEAIRDRGTRGVFASQGRMVGKRSAQNARAHTSVWLDIDLKQSQMFEQEGNSAALSLLRNFLAAVGLPEPSATISSGGGLHCYFVFPEAISKEQWS